MIQTSYYAKYRGDNGVSISLYPPKFYNGPEYKDLAPTKEILDWWNNLTEEQKHDLKYVILYIKRYEKQVLSKLDVNKVAKDLDGKVLLCYENANKDFCHRSIVRAWLKKNGYESEEIKYAKD